MWPVIVLLAGPVVAGLFSLVVQRARILHLVNLFTMLALAVAETVLTRQVLAEHYSATEVGSASTVRALEASALGRAGPAVHAPSTRLRAGCRYSV